VKQRGGKEPDKKVVPSSIFLKEEDQGGEPIFAVGENARKRCTSVGLMYKSFRRKLEVKRGYLLRAVV